MKTHCRRGHSLDDQRSWRWEEVTVRGKHYPVRRCKACRKEYFRFRYLKKLESRK